MEETLEHTAVTGGEDHGRRRLRGFGIHLVCYFLVMGLLVAINLLATPGYPWFLWPGVGWGGGLAFHAAYAMGLFGT